ncbi:MAG: class A beta-lactamase, subclass A2 [Prevotella sp.]|jgi:beta-lactamase class A|nr:class A beta-lactamase, subclass A2 [Prevotella sp.]
MKRALIILASIFFSGIYAFSQDYTPLRNSISQIVQGKQATVGVALIADGDTLTINNDFHYPMQSVYKFHLGMAVLDYIDNKIPLSHSVFVEKSELKENTHSPLRDSHPEGNFNISLGELIKYSVSLSDNNACDILFKFIGGPAKVDEYMRNIGVSDVSIMTTEEEMHKDFDLQYQNWTTPFAAASLLEKFRTGNLLSTEHYNFLWNTMKDTTTGSNKIKALLPKGTIVAHKTGSSFRYPNGLNAAENDIAIIRLPDGRYYSLAVFVADSMESADVNCRMIADISKAVYDYLVTNE